MSWWRARVQKGERPDTRLSFWGNKAAIRLAVEQGRSGPDRGND